MTTPRNEKCLFAYTPADGSANGVPTLLFLMSEQAWDYMKNGMCHEFDLTSLGISIQVIIGRCKDHAAGLALLRAAGSLVASTTDLTNSDIDLHLGGKPTKQ